MAIKIDHEQKIFYLESKNTSYVMGVDENGYLMHLYWGKKIGTSYKKRFFTPKGRASFSPTPEGGLLTLDDLPVEYPTYGRSDYRVPALTLQLEDGTTITDLRYDSYEIISGKPGLDGLPATYVEKKEEAQTLQVTLVDALIGLKVVLSYSMYEDYDAVTRSVRLINEGDGAIKITQVMSMNVDFETSQWDWMHLYGSWARERHVERAPLGHGVQYIDSKRGASSHNHNPFIALLEKEATEHYGDVYGFSLVYSGNFLAQIEVDQYNNTRVAMGLNSFDFTWALDQGTSFQAPECVMVYSDQGIGGMSRIYHKLYRERLCRGKYRDEVRPVLVNNWEATYFDFNEEKLLDIAKVGKDLGIELFVLDDGWFGKRNGDQCSLGDWFVNKEKLPNGLEGLCKEINQLGMGFGLWFEPEMVSPDSELYRRHPDWCIHVKGRSRTEGRKQLILDLSREDVCQYLIETVSDVLRSANITYVKWDMNRNMTEIGSALLPAHQQREVAHRYILGLYKVLEEITSRFPDILFESCSGGGGRFDPGMLYYMPQTWTSDDTDAVERLKIQYGTSMVYPVSTMGAHVSAVPNHQVGRITSLKMRGDVAMSGNFGYELDLGSLSDKEKEEMKEQIKTYKAMRKLIQYGDMYRLSNPFEGNEAAWMIVSPDQKEAFIGWFSVLEIPNGYKQRIKLKGLDPERIYHLNEGEEGYLGSELMYLGLQIPRKGGDFESIIWKLS